MRTMIQCLDHLFDKYSIYYVGPVIKPDYTTEFYFIVKIELVNSDKVEDFYVINEDKHLLKAAREKLVEDLTK
jgi:hypothetical protein